MARVVQEHKFLYLQCASATVLLWKPGHRSREGRENLERQFVKARVHRIPGDAAQRVACGLHLDIRFVFLAAPSIHRSGGGVELRNDMAWIRSLSYTIAFSSRRILSNIAG